MAKKDFVVHKKKPEFDPTAIVAGAPPKAMGQARLVTIARVYIDQSWNSREKIDFEGAEFVDLRESIRHEGLESPVTLAEREGDPDHDYDLVAGFRRIHACMQLGFTEILAVINTYETQADKLIANVVENTHRSGLRPYELAATCHRLRKEEGLTVKDIAARIQMSDSWVGKLTRIMEKLPAPILTSFRFNATPLAVEEYHTIASMDSQEQMLEAWKVRTAGDAKNPEKKAPALDDDGEEKKKKPKMVKPDAIKRFLAEMKNAEGIMIKGQQYEVTQDMQDAMDVFGRWVLGGLKKYPLVLPPDFEE